MDFLNKFFENVFQQPGYQTPVQPSQESIHNELAQHLERSYYGEFQLTDAVRPGMSLKVTPTQGYRHDTYVDEETGVRVPVIMAAATKEILFSVFMQLISRLGQSVDVVLETSHNHDATGHVDFYREQIDLPVLTSILWEYEQLLTNDGCSGVAVLNPTTPQEVQFDEHKLLIVYGSPLEPFEHILEKNGIFCNEHMLFITEAEHVHSSSESSFRKFESLKRELGLDTEAGTLDGDFA